MVFRLLYFICLIQACTSLLPSLKFALNQKSFLEKMISRSNEKILIVNSDIQIGLPCMYFSTNLPIPHVADQLCNSGEVYIILNSAEEKEFEEVKKIVRYCLAESYFLVMEEPSKSTFPYLEKNGIYKIVFVESQTQISEFNGWPTSDRNLKVCYTDHVPYTTIESSSNLHLKVLGFESLSINHSGNFANIPVKFIKHTEGCISGGPLGVFDHLKNRSCDVVIGDVMCYELLSSVWPSAYYMEDGTVLVASNIKCSRQLFTSPILASFLGGFISLVCVKISRLKLFVKAPLLLLTVVLFGYLQAELYDLLVTDKHKCGVKNLEDIVEKQVVTGIEPQLTVYLDFLGVPNVNLNTLKKYLTNDSVVNLRIQLDSDKPHVIRKMLFEYLVPRYYLKDNGDMKFRIVQTIHRHTYKLWIRNGYPYLNDLNLGISKFLASGISQYLEKQVIGYMDLRYIIKHSKLLSYFTPVNMQEFYWLFIVVLIMWIISVLVFLLEISLYNWKIWKSC